MPREIDSAHGALVVNSTGSVVFASGVFSLPTVATAVIQRWRREGIDENRVLSVRCAGQQLIVVGVPSEEAVFFICLSEAADDALFEFAATVPFAGDILRHLLTNPYEAMTVVDADGIVRYLSPIHRKFFGLAHGEGLDKHVTGVIENTRLHEVAKTGKAEIGQAQDMQGTTRVVTRVPIHSTDGKVVGAIGQVMFKGPEHLRQLSAEVGRLRSEVAFYRRELNVLRNKSTGLNAIIGNSPAIRRLKEEIVKVAPLDVPVLLVGESGTGKELVAHAIHMLSARREHPMVLVNAAALPATLVESELFGYEPGAFTGADRKGRKGKFEAADEGTLFFDEIGDMPPEVQVKLLRVLQDGVFERLGGERARESDFRFISASNRDFQKMIADGTFRLDLYYRMSTVTLRLPPLRERLEDVPLLVENALAAFASRHATQLKRIDASTIAYLQQQPWPGNVRQLIHTVERGAIFAEGEVILKEDFGRLSSSDPFGEEVAPITHASASDKVRPASVKDAVSEVEKNLIRVAMERFGGNKQRVAGELGISRSYLYKRLAEIEKT